MLNKKGIKNLILEDLFKKPLVLFEDIMHFDNIKAEFIDEHRHLTEEAENFVNLNFKKEQDNNSKIFNGIIFGLLDFDISNNIVDLKFEKCEYKYFLATKNKEYKKYICENNFFTVPISVTGIIITNDNKIFLCKPYNNFKIIGGYVDENDFKNNKINFKNTFFREVSEEVGELGIHNEKIIGISLYDSLNINCSCNTDFSSKDIINIINNNNCEDVYESDNITFINNNIESIGKFIVDNNKNISMNSLSAIKFYLKNRFNNYDYMYL